MSNKNDGCYKNITRKRIIDTQNKKRKAKGCQSPTRINEKGIVEQREHRKQFDIMRVCQTKGIKKRALISRERKELS